MKELIKMMNMNFVIRTIQNGKTTLRGAGVLALEIGEDAKNHYEKALYSGKDTHTLKLRRGLVIQFVSK